MPSLMDDLASFGLDNDDEYDDRDDYEDNNAKIDGTKINASPPCNGATL